MTKFMVYNARKRQEGGDTAKNYFMRTELIAGVQDMRFQELMPDALLWLNRYVNAVRKRMGKKYWSLAAFLKHKVKNAVSYIANFEHAVAAAARRRSPARGGARA